jgi:pre-mRNA-splicing factor RBM22/SLT11
MFSKFGEIKSVKILLKNFCAFINFLEREAAESAINTLFSKFSIKGQRYRLGWGKINFDTNKPNNEDLSKLKEIDYQTQMPTISTGSLNLLDVYDESKKPYYPSMDPNAYGGDIMSKKKQKIQDKKELAFD